MASERTPGPAVPVRTRKYPSWVSGMLTARQVKDLPPALVWAKAVQRTRVFDGRAVNVAQTLAIGMPGNGRPRKYSERQLAKDAHRDRKMIRAGLAALRDADFLFTESTARGLDGAHHLLLPADQPELPLPTNVVRLDAVDNRAVDNPRVVAQRDQGGGPEGPGWWSIATTGGGAEGPHRRLDVGDGLEGGARRAEAARARADLQRLFHDGETHESS